MLADEITQQLIETRRHFLQTVMKFTLIIASVLVVSATIALFTLPNPLIRIYASGVTLLWIGNALSFWMIQKRPLAQAILPVTIAILLILVLSSLAAVSYTHLHYPQHALSQQRAALAHSPAGPERSDVADGARHFLRHI